MMSSQALIDNNSQTQQTQSSSFYNSVDKPRFNMYLQDIKNPIKIDFRTSKSVKHNKLQIRSHILKNRDFSLKHQNNSKLIQKNQYSFHPQSEKELIQNSDNKLKSIQYKQNSALLKKNQALQQQTTQKRSKSRDLKEQQEKSLLARAKRYNYVQNYYKNQAEKKREKFYNKKIKLLENAKINKLAENQEKIDKVNDNLLNFIKSQEQYQNSPMIQKKIQEFKYTQYQEDKIKIVNEIRSYIKLFEYQKKNYSLDQIVNENKKKIMENYFNSPYHIKKKQFQEVQQARIQENQRKQIEKELELRQQIQQDDLRMLKRQEYFEEISKDMEKTLNQNFMRTAQNQEKLKELEIADRESYYSDEFKDSKIKNKLRYFSNGSTKQKAISVKNQKLLKKIPLQQVPSYSSQTNTPGRLQKASTIQNGDQRLNKSQFHNYNYVQQSYTCKHVNQQFPFEKKYSVRSGCNNVQQNFPLQPTQYSKSNLKVKVLTVVQ